MKIPKFKLALTCLAPVAMCVVLAGCSRASRTESSATPTPSPAGTKPSVASTEQPDSSTEHSASPPASVSPPAHAEALAALERVYKKATIIDKANPSPFVAGDFNGDGSEDIAIAVKPAGGMLDEINSEFANWIVEDPKRFTPSETKRNLKSAPEPAPAKIEQQDVLLAIIHGHGQEGWRSKDATQSYLLKNAAGVEMRAVPLRSFPGALKVKKDGVNSRADIISEKLAGTAGFIYWASGKYAWHEE